MAEVLGITAFIMAFGAIYLASELMRRFRALDLPATAPNSDASHDKEIQALRKQVKVLEERVRELDRGNDVMTALEAEAAKLRGNLAEQDRFVPSDYINTYLEVRNRRRNAA